METPTSDSPIDLSALVQELTKRGYTVTQDVVLLVHGRKDFETAVGPREAAICVFRAQPGAVYPRYESEGRNILEAYGWDFRNGISQALDACEKAIANSYAARLLRNRTV